MKYWLKYASVIFAVTIWDYFATFPEFIQSYELAFAGRLLVLEGNANSGKMKEVHNP